MNEALEQLKSIYAKFRNLKTSYGKDSIKPHHDWQIILYTTSIFLFLGAIMAFYFYWQIDAGKLFFLSENNALREVKLDTRLLKITTDDVYVRENSFLNIRQNKSTPPEPSI